MANWNLPTVTSGYLDFVTEMNDKFADAATMFGIVAPVNPPVGSLRFNRGNNAFEEFVGGSTWVIKVLGVAGGGTGGSNATEIRANLGLGSMSTQNSNAVAITGGSISGVNIDAGSITGGIVALARGGTGSSLPVGGAGQILMSNGAVTYWDTGINTSQLNASVLVTGTVPNARLDPNVAFRNKDNNFIPQTISSGSVIGGNNAALYFNDAGAPANLHYWRLMQYNNGNIYLESLNDSMGATAQFAFDRAGGLNCTGFGGSGAGLHSLNGSNIASGIIATARLGSGSAHSGTFLRGDGVWAPVSGGAPVDPVPSGLIAIFTTGCPAGWTRVAGLDNRFPLGHTQYGLFGGNATHLHRVDFGSQGGGTHRHRVDIGGRANGSASGSASGSANGSTGDNIGSTQGADAGGSFSAVRDHHHDFGVNINIPVTVNVDVPVNVGGDTNDGGDHNHRVYGDTDQGGDYPPYMSVVYCIKN